VEWFPIREPGDVRAGGDKTFLSVVRPIRKS
jgi:hypothetical protein